MARRRSVTRRAGGGWRVPPAAILATVLVAGAIALIATHAGQNGGPGQVALQAGDDGASAAGRVATGPFRAGENLFDRIGVMWQATARIEELEDENRDLLAWKALAERLAERNARYEALLRMPADNFGEGADIGSSIAAQLVLDSGGPFTRTLVANAGSDHGVRVGFIAINENGLVGRVVSVGRRSSRVLMLDDYNSRIPVMGEASRVRAVLAGQATQPPELYTRPFEVESPRLDFIVGAQSLREGERMVTSGDGGLYPRGVAVGLARHGSDGVWRVTLATTRQPIDFVRLVPFVGAPRPEDAPVDDAGPPPDARSAVASVGREVMPPPPIASQRPGAVIPAPQAPPAAQAPRPAAPQPAAPAPTPAPPADEPVEEEPAPPEPTQ